MAFQPIENYGVIGNMQSIALVGVNGSIDFLCYPNFDSPTNASVGTPSILGTTFGQTCCATVATPSTQTIIQTGESARIIQFALKVMF